MKKALTALFLILLMVNTLFPSVLAFVWEIERPSTTIELIEERVENANANDEAAAGIGVHINAYRESSTTPPFLERDGFELRVVGTANTRRGIQYDANWHDGLYFPPDIGPVFEHTLSLGDDEGVWLSLSYVGPITCYSGPGLQNNSLYSKVWVCSNGFLCLEGEYTNPNPPSTVPNPQSPNAFIAPYWSNLDPAGGIVSWGMVGCVGVNYFAVGWHNVLDKANNQRQSFAVFIQERGTYERTARFQNRIIFQYYDAQGSSNAVYGIEDQEGYKGLGGSPGTWRIKAIELAGDTSAPEIREMTIKLEKQDTQAEIYIGTDCWELGGYNLQWKVAQPAPEPWYHVAIRGGATLLMSAAIGYFFGPVAGFMFGTAVVGYETAEAFSKSLWQAQEAEKEDANATENLAYISVPAAGSSSLNWPLDALIGAQIYWIFTDTNTDPHQLEISIELEYYSYQLMNETTVSTSVYIACPRDAGNSIDDPNVRVIEPGTYKAFVGTGVPPPGCDDARDFYKIWIDGSHGFDISMKPPNSTTINFDLHLYNPNKQLRKSSENGANVTEYIHYPAYEGDWYIEVNATAGHGVYNLTVSLYGLGGGCPFVYVWNGQEHVIDNNLLAASEANGIDVEDYYKLEQSLVADPDGTYSLKLSEFENEHDYFDQAQLLAADHSSDVKVAMSPYNEILTYTEPYTLKSAVDENGENVKHLLGSIDGNYYQGYNGSYITLNFGNLDIRDHAKLVLRSDADVVKSIHIYVQTQDEKGQWNDVASFIPRTYWATDIIDLSNVLGDEERSRKIRLHFTAPHKLDYVGLDTSSEATVNVQQGELVTAVHSVEGDLKASLLYSDDVYAELIPAQSIQLTFTLPQQTMEARTYIIIIEGRYHAITEENL